jgi:hypothetical protein
MTDYANLPEDDMSNDSLGRFIQEQFSSFRKEMRSEISSVKEDVKEDVGLMRDDLKDVKTDVRNMSESLDDINTQLGGHDGIRERLTALEVQMGQALTNKSLSTYPPPSSAPVKRRNSIKDHAPALGAGAGSAGLLYAVIELAQAFLKTK